MRKKFLWRLASISLLLVALTMVLSRQKAAAEPAKNDDIVVRVYYNNIAELEKLAAYDVWEYNNLDEQYVLVAVNETDLITLEKAGWQLEIDEAASSQIQQTSLFTFNGGYRTVTELYADLTAVNNTHPTLTQLVDYGDSYCKNQGGCTTPGGNTLPGRDLLALRITNEAISGDKPIFFLMSNIHAREITTPELSMRFIDWLVDNYGTDADATWLVDHHEIWVVPVVNPDGHEIVELGPYYQRKNANPENGCSTNWPPSSSTHYGIDLNRNHSFGWNTGGSSGAACNATYRGPSAASESEVSQLQTLVLSLIPDQRGPNITDPAPQDTTGIFITIHSYSELVLWPWGNTTGAAPNKTGLKAIGDKLATYNGYTSCQPSICLYSTSGTSDDWAYGELGIPSFTFEVGTSFMPNYNVIDSTQWPENKPAFIYAAKIARTPYMTAQGPDALNIASSSDGSNNLNITATINDSNNGGQAISGAVYYIDTPPWAGGTPDGAFTATDGTFNSAIEGVQATLDTSSLSSGQHILYVEGEDNQGNKGAFSAIFFNAGPPATSTPGPSPTAPPPTYDVFLDDFETNQGWTTNPDSNDTATTGQWERGNPEQTASGSNVLQLGTTASGSNALVTGRLAGSSVGTHDIDGGETSVRSPNINLPISSNINLSFAYYLAHLNNATTADYLRVKVVGSTTNTILEELGAGDTDVASWQTFNANLSSFGGQTIYLLIEAADASSGSLVEAAIDDVAITAEGSTIPTSTPPPPTPTNTPPPTTPTNTPLPPTPTNTPPPPSCTTYTSSNVPIALPNGTATINSNLSVSGSGTIADLNITVDMDHVWVGDLTFTLTNGSTSVTIIERPGVPATTWGCSNDNITATLDDEAGMAVEGVCASTSPTINGTFSPNNALSAFDGQSSNGTWTLQISDAYTSADAGTLNGWSIEVCTQ